MFLVAILAHQNTITSIHQSKLNVASSTYHFAKQYHKSRVSNVAITPFFQESHLRACAIKSFLIVN
jgi:hypothetical protein